MRKVGLVGMVLATACNSSNANGPLSDAAADATSADASTITSGWNAPEEIGPTNCCSSPTLSTDMLELFHSAGSTAIGTDGQIYRNTRPDSSGRFSGAGEVVGPSSSGADEAGPDLSADGLEMYFTRSVAGGPQGFTTKIHRAVRSAGGTFDSGTQVLELDQAVSQFNPSVSRDGNALVWEVSDTATPFWTARKLATNRWSAPAPVQGISGDAHSPMFAPDGSTLIFDRRDIPFFPARLSGLYVATLDSTTGVYNAAVPLAEINDNFGVAYNRSDPWLSSDGKHLVFVRRQLTIEGDQSLHLMHAVHQ